MCSTLYIDEVSQYVNIVSIFIFYLHFTLVLIEIYLLAGTGRITFNVCHLCGEKQSEEENGANFARRSTKHLMLQLGN